MIKKLENIFDFIHDNEYNYNEFLRFTMNNKMKLYVCNFPAILVNVFDVISNKVRTDISFIARSQVFISLDDFKKYYDEYENNKYFVIYKITRVPAIANRIFIRYIAINKNNYKLIKIKCELDAI